MDSGVKTIYMVEDELLLGELFEEFVSDFPYLRFVGRALDGETAVKECQQLKPDIVVLDLRVPGFNGLDILQFFHKALPSCCMILFTGSLSEESLRACLEYNACGYIEKAYGLEELQKGIEAAMEGRKHYSPGVAALLKSFKVS